MAIHEECGVFGVMGTQKEMWKALFIMGCMPCSTEDSRVVGLL